MNKPMKKTLFATLLSAVVLSLGACASSPKTIELFNGRDLEGWGAVLQDKSLDPKTEFTVRDGVIHLSGKFGYIYPQEIYSNYKLEVEWRWPGEASNSGIFVHVSPDDRWLPSCFECQLKAGNAGSIYGFNGPLSAEMRAAGNNTIQRKEPNNERPTGEWNKAEIVCDGDRISITINGELQVEATGVTPASGNIGLQSEGEAVEFRNVRLTPLSI